MENKTELMPKLLSDKEVARLLGISRAKVWNLVKEGFLEKVQLPPRSTRFRLDDIEKICANAEQK